MNDLELTQYRIVQRTNRYSVTTFVIQKHSWFKWRDVKLFNSGHNASIAKYKTLGKAIESVEFIIMNPSKDLVLYKQ